VEFDECNSLFSSFFAEARQLFNSIPVRIACVHQCFDDTPLFQFYRGMNVLMMNGAFNKMRLQTHLGSSSCEIRYKLLGYGIPVDCTCSSIRDHGFISEIFNIAALVLTIRKSTVLPFTDSNNLKTKHHHLWMRGRRAVEQQQNEIIRTKKRIVDFSNVVDCPAMSDVVFKPGTSSLHHPGNSVFHEMLRNQSDDSQISPDTVGVIYENVTRRNGRFLEWDSCGYWKVMSDPVAIRQKIYNSIFYAKKSSNARKRRQNTTSNTFMFERQDGTKRKRAADGTEISSCIEICR
jgi:hypothetical protein